MRQRVKIVIKEEIVRELYAIAGEDAVQTAEPMKNHTTFRVGGPADYFVAPHTEEEIREIVALCEKKEIPWFVTGNGSNLVVSDEGYHGVILSVYKNFQGIEVEGNRIRAKAGSMLVSISQAAREAGLSGMEFASGIPGTLGGGVRMNAGAYGGEMKDIVQNVTVLTRDGEIRELEKEELGFGYRASIIKDRGYVVLGAELMLVPGDKEEILARMQELKNKRVEKQPLEYPSAGSAFKRLFCRQACDGCRAFRLRSRRCKSIGKTLRLPDQCRRCNRIGCDGTDPSDPGKSKRTVWRTA